MTRINLTKKDLINSVYMQIGFSKNISENLINDFLIKIKENLKIENLNIIDNTSKHKTHKFFDHNKYHLCLEIESNYLKNMKRIDAQRVLFTILKEEMNTKIHALEIKIK